MNENRLILKPGEPFEICGIDWAVGNFLTAQIDYSGEHAAKLNLRFFVSGDTDPAMNICFGYIPGTRAHFCFETRFLDGQTLFMPRHPGQLKGTCIGRRIERNEIVRAELLLEETGYAQQCFISKPVLLEEKPEFSVESGGALVDPLGQQAAREWPGKTRDEEELRKYLRCEYQNPDHGWPSSWSRFGGHLGRPFKPGGFFRTEHDGKRWWLVDPDGCGFFSAGLDCVRSSGDDCIVPGTEKLFSWLPEKGGEFDDCMDKHGARGLPLVRFGNVNLRRAFGDKWRRRWASVTTARLHRWRINTIACWSDIDYARRARIPYVAFLKAYPSTDRVLFRDLPDVFDPAFESGAKEYARQMTDYADDPYLIGYFMTNEPAWGFGSFNLAAEILETQPGSHTRRALAGFVSTCYSGDASKWREAWNLEVGASFEDLIAKTYHHAADQSLAAKTELFEFSREIVRRFVRIPAEALRRVAPRHLNLGLRFAWIASDLFYEIGDYIDVFSLNCYQMLPDTATADEIARRCNHPVLIGEFHFGALDRGLTGTGLRGVANQLERGVAYRTYLETCAASSSIVGCHYFTLNDEPVLGRFDGENWQIGFVDVCHKPYEELCAAASLSHERMYQVRDGSIEPFAQTAQETAKIGF